MKSKCVCTECNICVVFSAIFLSGLFADIFQGTQVIKTYLGPTKSYM